LTFGDIEEAERERKLTWAEQMASGRPFLEVHREFRNRDVQNVSISYCFNCTNFPSAHGIAPEAIVCASLR
jgi:hypothetical protein